MKYGARSFPSGTAVIETGGRQAAGFASGDAQESAPCANPALKRLVRRDGRIDGARRHSRRDRRASHGSQQPALKCSRVRRIAAHQVHHAPGQQIAEQAESGAQHRVRRDLPRDRRPRLQDRQRRCRENVAQAGLNRGAQWLIHVVRDANRTSPAGAPTASCGFSGIRIVRVAQPEGPRQLRRDLPRVLRVEIEVQEIETARESATGNVFVAVDATP